VRVYGGVEVIDSRYRDFRFTLPDVVADNAPPAASSHAGTSAPSARRRMAFRVAPTALR
jgi:2-oxo-3-hexenedioate decarboxylase